MKTCSFNFVWYNGRVNGGTRMKSQEMYVKPESEYFFYTPTLTARKMYFYPICLGRFYYTEQYHIKRERYDSFLIMLITKGSCKVTIPEGRYIANEGDVVILDCYAMHQYESVTQWEAIWIHFDGVLSREYYNQICTTIGNVIRPHDIPVVTHALNKIIYMFQEANTIVEASISKYITLLLTELLLTNASASKDMEKQNSLSAAITHINEQFSKSISLEYLAKISSLSPFYFSRLFTKQVGVSPHQYIITTRVNFAKFLLITTTLSIKEISFQSGFTSESSFCAMFKKKENVTPSEYRKLGII